MAVDSGAAGGPVRLGCLYPGFAAEDDYPVLAARVRAQVDVRMEVVHTTVGEDAHRIDALLDLGSEARLLGGAEELARRGVDVVLWACTSGSFVFGLEGARRQVQPLADTLGVPASSTSLAYVSALQALSVRRVAVAATYPAEVTDRFVAFLSAAGFEVVAAGSNDIITAEEVGTFTHDRVIDIVTSGDHPAAEAVLVPDTALHTAAWLEEFEAAVGKPVLTANQVTVWEALRLAGARMSGDGLGALFRVSR